MQRAAAHQGFVQLLRDQREKEGHRNFVHGKRERMRQAEITLRVAVGPDQRNHRSQRQ